MARLQELWRIGTFFFGSFDFFSPSVQRLTAVDIFRNKD